LVARDHEHLPLTSNGVCGSALIRVSEGRSVGSRKQTLTRRSLISTPTINSRRSVSCDRAVLASAHGYLNRGCFFVRVIETASGNLRESVRRHRRALRSCLCFYVGWIGLHAATPYSLLNDCHPRPVNANHTTAKRRVRRSPWQPRSLSPRQTLSHNERRERTFECASSEIFLIVNHSLAERSVDVRSGPRSKVDSVTHNKA
jgi:hypothetical protein